MRELLNRNAGSLSLLAVVIATLGACLAGASAAGVFVTGKHIKNGSITASDLHKNAVGAKAIDKGAVKSAEIGAAQVRSSDIGTNQVTAQALDLPDPTQVVMGEVVGPVGPEFSAFADVASYDKTSADSVLHVDWSGVAAGGPGTNCIYQIRVNGQPPQRGGSEVFAAGGGVNVSTSALFGGLPAGAARIEVWARYSAKLGENPTCILNPAANPGITSTFLIIEDVT